MNSEIKSIEVVDLLLDSRLIVKEQFDAKPPLLKDFKSEEIRNEPVVISSRKVKKGQKVNSSLSVIDAVTVIPDTLYDDCTVTELRGWKLWLPIQTCAVKETREVTCSYMVSKTETEELEKTMTTTVRAAGEIFSAQVTAGIFSTKASSTSESSSYEQKAETVFEPNRTYAFWTQFLIVQIEYKFEGEVVAFVKNYQLILDNYQDSISVD